MRARPSIRRPWHCAGSRLAMKYKNGLGAHIGDGFATRIKPGNTCTATGFHGGSQQPSSENGFGNWVWTFECPPDLAIGLRLCLYFITFWLFNYFLIIDWLHAFHFYFYPICTLVLLMLFNPWHEMENIYKHIFQINGKVIRDYNFHNLYNKSS